MLYLMIVLVLLKLGILHRKYSITRSVAQKNKPALTERIPIISVYGCATHIVLVIVNANGKKNEKILSNLYLVLARENKNVIVALPTSSKKATSFLPFKTRLEKAMNIITMPYKINDFILFICFPPF